jgi:hypothetical protein
MLSLSTLALKGNVVASWNKEQKDKRAGAEVTVPCVKCACRTAHEIVTSMDQSGYVEEADIHWDASSQIIRCKGCKSLSFRREASNSEDFIQIGDDEWVSDIDEKLYPPRVEGLKDLGTDVVYLPSDLRRVYAETTHALHNDCPVLAGIGLRALVETVCKEKGATGGDLYAKINSLATTNILTPSGAQILHKVRTLGNKAAHEVKPHTTRQLSLALGVVEHMLRDIYILPKLVENEFEE